MRDQVPNGDGQQSGRDGTHGEQSRDAQDDEENGAQESSRGNRVAHDRVCAERRVDDERVEVDLCLREAVEDDCAGAQRDEHEVADVPRRRQQPICERPTNDAVVTRVQLVLIGEGERGQPAQNLEPHAERLAVGKPRLSAEVGHRGDADERVGDKEQAKRLTALNAEHELEPDDDDEADERRPAAEPIRVLGGLAAVDAEPICEPPTAADGSSRTD